MFLRTCKLSTLLQANKTVVKKMLAFLIFIFLFFFQFYFKINFMQKNPMSNVSLLLTD